MEKLVNSDCKMLRMEPLGLFVKKYRLLLIGIVLATAAIYMHSLILEKGWVMLAVAIECFVAFLAAVIDKDIRLSKLIGWTIIYFAMVLIAMNLLSIIPQLTGALLFVFFIGNMAGWAIFGIIIGFFEKKSLFTFFIIALVMLFLITFSVAGISPFLPL